MPSLLNHQHNGSLYIMQQKYLTTQSARNFQIPAPNTILVHLLSTAGHLEKEKKKTYT